MSQRPSLAPLFSAISAQAFFCPIGLYLSRCTNVVIGQFCRAARRITVPLHAQIHSMGLI
jgi:hypothetical protein